MAEMSATQIIDPDRRKNSGDPITKADLRNVVDTFNGRFAAQDVLLKKMDDALFYRPKDEDDATPPGIVPVLRKIDKHVDVLCSMTGWFATLLKWGVPVAAGLVTIYMTLKL